MKTTPKTLYIFNSRTQGVFIATREEGGQGTNPGPKRGRSRGHKVAARAALRAARCLFCPPVSSCARFLVSNPWF